MSDLLELAAKMLDGVMPGPWTVEGPPWNQIIWSSAENRVAFLAHSNGLDDDRDIATARFIAWAREAVPALSSRVAELERDVARLRTDCAILLAQIDATKDVNGVGPEDEDAALVEQIRADLRRRWMGLTQPAPTEYARKLAQLKEDFPNGI